MTQPDVTNDIINLIRSTLYGAMVTPQAIERVCKAIERELTQQKEAR